MDFPGKITYFNKVSSIHFYSEEARYVVQKMNLVLLAVTQLVLGIFKIKGIDAIYGPDHFFDHATTVNKFL
jgi:hypothetical protein